MPRAPLPRRKRGSPETTQLRPGDGTGGSVDSAGKRWISSGLFAGSRFLKFLLLPGQMPCLTKKSGRKIYVVGKPAATKDSWRALETW